ASSASSASLPATVRANGAPIVSAVAVKAHWTHLAGMGRVYPCHPDTSPLRCIGDEGGQLVECPGGDHGVVLAGFGPMAFTCRAPEDTGRLLHAHDPQVLLLGVGDDCTRELVVDVAHPAPLFARTLAHGADLLGPFFVAACAGPRTGDV